MDNSGKTNKNSTGKWVLGSVILILAIFLVRYGNNVHSIIPPTITIESTIQTPTEMEMGVKEVITYECREEGKIIYATIILSPFQGIPPYEIEVIPVIKEHLDIENSFNVEPEKPFSILGGSKIVYSVFSSGTSDGLPKISGIIIVPLISKELCDRNQPSINIERSTPSSLLAPTIQPPLATSSEENTSPSDENTSEGNNNPTIPPLPTFTVPPLNTFTPFNTLPPTSAPTLVPTKTKKIEPTEKPEINECADGIDNDGDNLIDLADPHCENGKNDHED